MRCITPLNSNLDICEEVISLLAEKKYKPDFVITTYVEEKQTKHITFNITENNRDTDDFNLWLDIDVYQAELLAKKILRLVEDRKEFMSKILDDEKL